MDSREIGNPTLVNRYSVMSGSKGEENVEEGKRNSVGAKVENKNFVGLIIDNIDVEGEQKLSLINLASLIEINAKEDAKKLDLQGRLMDQVEWLPDSIGKLNNLTEIILFENRIVTLPRKIEGFSKLKKQDTHANQLMNLLDSIGELPNLTDLDLHGNHL